LVSGLYSLFWLVISLLQAVVAAAALLQAAAAAAAIVLGQVFLCLLALLKQ
jgi:hypothetical protein